MISLLFLSRFSNSFSPIYILSMARIQTAEITPRYCRHLLPFKVGKFGAVWALDGATSTPKLDMCQNPQQTAEVISCHLRRNRDVCSRLPYFSFTPRERAEQDVGFRFQCSLVASSIRNWSGGGRGDTWPRRHFCQNVERSTVCIGYNTTFVRFEDFLCTGLLQAVPVLGQQKSVTVSEWHSIWWFLV